MLAAAVVILGLVAAGFVHLVHGGTVGLKLCAKHSWTLGDTFVDLDEDGARPVSKLASARLLEAMYECGALRRPAHDDEVSSQRSLAPMERTATPRPALPQEESAEAPPEDSRFVGQVTPETQRKRTQVKVQKYVHEAYPAWLRAHPGEECPRRLVELSAYMENDDANDAWGRPLKMFCGPARAGGAKGIEVLSLGRDAEEGSEDDIDSKSEE